MGAAYFLTRPLIGAPSDASAAVQGSIVALFFGFLLILIIGWGHWTHRKLSAQGKIECYLRGPGAVKGGRYRKWQFSIVTPQAGVLHIQPVYGRTSIPQGVAFELPVTPVAIDRSAATKWDKFNRLEAGAVIMTLQTGEGLFEVAGQSSVLDKIESGLRPNLKNISH